jgi:hypothetical protein
MLFAEPSRRVCIVCRIPIPNRRENTDYCRQCARKRNYNDNLVSYHLARRGRLP